MVGGAWWAIQANGERLIGTLPQDPRHAHYQVGAGASADGGACAGATALITAGLALVTVLVANYDEALAFYIDVLGFDLVSDIVQEPATSSQPAKRWVVVSHSGDGAAGLLLALADGDAQRARIGDQTGGRVGFFLYTDNFQCDLERMQDAGVRFPRGEPRHEPYGTVVVFEDLYGNLWDLIQPTT